MNVPDEVFLWAAPQLLENIPLRVLEATAGAAGDGVIPVTIDTDNIGRVDVFVDDRPFGSHNVTQGPNVFEVPDSASSVRFDGYSGTDLVVSNRLELP